MFSVNIVSKSWNICMNLYSFSDAFFFAVLDANVMAALLVGRAKAFLSSEN